jgi:3-oxoacyl-[acyl-carrier protein] reductase
VNNVQPGPIDTDLNPASGDWAVPQKAVTALNRYGRVDEVAALLHLSRARNPRISLAPI